MVCFVGCFVNGDNICYAGTSGAEFYFGTGLPPNKKELLPVNEETLTKISMFKEKFYTNLNNNGIYFQDNGGANDYIFTPFWGNDDNLKKLITDAINQAIASIPDIMDHIEVAYSRDAVDITPKRNK